MYYKCLVNKMLRRPTNTVKYLKYHKLGDASSKKAFKYKRWAAERKNNKKGGFKIAQTGIALFCYLLLFY
jgi:hypothetical protein